MSRSITFLLDGRHNDTRITVTEEADGRLRFDVENEAGHEFDLRAFFFDLDERYEYLAAGLSIEGEEVKRSLIELDDVTKVGGAPINGRVVQEFGAFDVGVKFERGTSRDDDPVTTFFVDHVFQSLDLDMIAGADFGVRLAGKGGKIGETATLALRAVDDAFGVGEDDAAQAGNLLANDRSAAGLAVIGASVGGEPIAVSDWATVVTQAGREARLQVEADGTLRFDPAGRFDAMAEGETDTLTVRYASTAANGSTDGGEAIVTIAGTNDGPVAALDVAEAVENGPALWVDVLANDFDPDSDDDASTLRVVAATASSGALVAFTGEPGAGLRYRVDTTAAFESLASGETANDTITYTVEDRHGARAEGRVEIAVTGTNDAPVASRVDRAKTLAEDDSVVAGSLIFDDADLTDTHALSFAPGEEGYEGTFFAQLAQGATGAANGVVAWTFVSDPAAFQSLGAGETVEQRYAIMLDDGNGGTIEEEIVVTVTGTNDAPVVAGPIERRVSEEDAPLTIDLLEGASDIDANDRLAAVNVSEASGQGGWTLDGDTITVDPAHFDALNDGETATLLFDYTIDDGKGGMTAQTAGVTVDGYTDAPFVSVGISAGDAANVALVAVSITPARGEAVALSFGGLPAGAVIRDPLGADVTGGIANADLNSVLTLELPLDADLGAFTVQVAGIATDGSVIGTRDAVIELGYTSGSASRSLTFTAADANIWGEGDEFSYEYSEYIPLLGGERETFTLLEATTDVGTVFLDGDDIEWIPGDAFATLPAGETATQVFSISYVDDADADVIVTDTVEVTVTGGNFAPEYSGAGVKIRDEKVIIDALSNVDVLRDPLSTGELTLIDIGIDTDEVFASLLEPLTATVTALDIEWREEEAKLAEAQNRLEDVSREGELLAQINLQSGIVSAREAVYVVAREAAETADEAVQFFRDALGDAKASFDVFNDSLDDARAVTLGAKSAYEATIKTIKVPLVGNVTVSDPVKWTAWKAAEGVQKGAQELVDLARTGVKLAQDALDSALVSNSVDALENQRDIALGELNAARAAVDDTLEVLRSEGFYGQNEEPSLSDIARVGALVTQYAGEVAFFTTTVTGLEILRDGAQLAEDTAQATIDNVDLRARLEASVEAFAQAGLQFDFAISGGSVDAQIEYDLSATTAYNEATDVLTLKAVLENTITGETAAFTTASPDVQVYAGLLYDIGATFEFLVDFYAALGSSVLADLSPDSDGVGITLAPGLEGALDFIDFDSRDGGDIDFGVSFGDNPLSEILDFSLSVPSIETIGREADASLDYYREGDLLELDFGELLGSFRNLMEARIEISPEMQALLNQAGVDGAGSFLDTLVDALGAIVASASGEGDTDGDGVVPIFLLDATDETNGALLHINAIADDLSGIDPATLGQFGFYAAYGESDRIVEVTLDVDQLAATIANRLAGNPTDIVVNPFDLGIDVQEFLEIAGVNDETAQRVERYIDLELNAEFADFDVSTGLNFSQEFTLSIDDMSLLYTMEDGTEFIRDLDAGAFSLDNASQYDMNGDGRIDYDLAITPEAAFSNDTELGLGFSYMLDLVKTSFEASLNLPLDELLGDLTVFGVEPEFKLNLFNSAIGPVFRVEGDIDAVTLDIFEDRFAFDLGTQSVALGTGDPLLA